MPQLTTVQPVHDIWWKANGASVAVPLSVWLRYKMTSGEMIVETGPARSCKNFAGNSLRVFSAQCTFATLMAIRQIFKLSMANGTSCGSRPMNLHQPRLRLYGAPAMTPFPRSNVGMLCPAKK